MKKITTFLALLLTCIIGATAADFVPVSGAKYLIKCKGDSKYAIWNQDCKKTIDGTEYNSLSNWDKCDTRSYFTVEGDATNGYYIKPFSNSNYYVFAVNTIGTDGDKAHAEGNVAIKEVTGTPGDECKWKIVAQGDGWNIIPSTNSESNTSWNNRGDDGHGNNTIGQWNQNTQATNVWYFIQSIVPDNMDGYYTMSTKDADRGPYLYNDFSNDHITRGSALPTTVSNKYVWHVTSAPGNKFTLVNGEGTVLGLRNGRSLRTIEAEWTDGNQYYFFKEKLDAGNRNAGYGLDTWDQASKDYAQDLFKFDDASYSSVYTVECNLPDGYVTYKTTSEKAKNGGFFNITTTPTADQFTANSLDGYDAAITIEGKTIKVSYTHNYAYVKAEADAAIAKTGVGYPTANAAARTTLQQAIAAAEAAEHNASTAATLYIAVNTYKNSKVDIQMPEDGKAYVITNVHKTGGKRYMKYESDGTSMVVRNDETVLPIEATYICHKVGDKYVFTNNSGTYLTWRGNATGDCTNSNLGYTASYDADYNTFTVAANPDVFGCLSFGAKRNGNTNKSYYIVTNTGSFGKAGFNDYYDEDHSSAFLFEEVTYPNTITFHEATNIEGVNHIATFSAPFATIIPEGVKAYYVSAKDTQASMTAIEASQAIPANQGVILTSETGTSVTMVPAADETAATISDNKLGHSAGAAKTLTAGEVYILANGTSGTAFYPCKAGELAMNKAYLLGNDGGKAITMNFGNTVTAINGITTNVANAQAPIYDLSGRRVMSAAKSGLYIQNGKKFIVK